MFMFSEPSDKTETEKVAKEKVDDMKTQDIIERLLEKSQEAYIVGVELYNKPTIKYRVEGFSFFICNAWELLLKALLLKRGESIYHKDSSTRTLPLDRIIGKVLTNEDDPVRKNLDKIKQLRNTSTHYVIEEYELIYVPLFQACVNNYAIKLKEYVQIEKGICARFD